MNIAGGPHEEQISILTETGRFDCETFAFAYLKSFRFTTAKPWISTGGRSRQSLMLLTTEKPDTTIGCKHKRPHLDLRAGYPKPARSEN